MKLTKLLVLGALMLSGTSAWAVDGNVWVKPAVPDGVAMEMDVEYYFYNVGSDLFFTQGNAWGTQASAGTDGLKVKIAQTEAGAYTLTDYVKTQNAWKMWWFVDNSADPTMYVDYNNQANYLWSITDMGNNVYRLSPSLSNPFTEFAEGMFVGLNRTSNTSTTVLTWNNTAESGAFIDWKLIPAETFDIDAHNVAVKTFEAAMELKKALEEAEALSVDVTDELTVYNNTESTADQLSTAAESVKKKVAEAGMNSATAANPKDASSYIVNYDFAKSTTNGWTPEQGTDNFGAYNGKENAELYDKNKFNVYQTVSGLPNGVYAVGVNAFYRAGNSVEAYKHFAANDEEMNYAKLYATSADFTATTPLASPYKGAPTEKPGTGDWSQDEGKQFFIPNNMVAAEYAMHTMGLYSNKVLLSIDNGSVTIGVKKDKHIGSDWAIFDDFSLTYYGNGADAYQMWSDNALSQYAAVPEGALYTDSYMATLTAAVTGKTATNKEEVLANIAAAEAARADLDDNLNLWNQWKEAVAEGVSTINTYLMLEDDAIYNLMEYCDETYDERESLKILEAHNLDNEALTAEIAKVKALVAAVIEAAKNAVKEGDDMTQYLTNPDFAEGQKGWTGWKSVAQQKWGDGSLNMPVVNESCAEAFSAPNFDLYQEVEGLPLGIYEVSVQGFFRFGRGDDAWNAWNTQGEERSDYVKVDDPALGSPVFFYVNEKQTPFINVYQEDGRPGDSPLFDDLDTPANEGRTPLLRYGSDGKEITEWVDASEINSVENCQTVEAADGNKIFFPDGMKSAHNYFNADAYKQTTFSAVAHKGDKLRIGVKGHSDVGVSATNLDSWAIFDNFKLIYRGTSKEVVKPVLQDAIEVAKAKQKLSVAKDVKDELAAAIAAAEEAYNNDADNMFSVLANLWSVDVNSSLQKIQAIEAALPAFEEAVAAAEYLGDDERPLESVITEAKETRGTAQDYVDGNVEFTNADLDAILQKMEELTKALKVPAGMHTATDDNFANATYLINNPTYDSNADGWTFTGDAGNKRQAEGVYEIWRTKVDCGLYQDLTDMPEGTYELSVQGIYRFGYADSEYPAFIETPAENNNAWVYVTVGETETKSLLPRLSSIAEYYEAEAEVYGEETKYLPKNTNVTDNGDGTFKFDQHFQWGQMTVAEDAQSASGYILPDQLDVTTPFFDSGEVVNTSIIFKVGAEGKARIGINIKYVKDGDWTVWDNWKLTYYGKNSAKEVGPVNGIKDASSVTEIVKTEVFNLNGARVKTGKGIAIVRQTLSDGTVRVKKVMMK